MKVQMLAITELKCCREDHVVQDFYSFLNNLSITVNYNPSLENKVFHKIIASYISSWQSGLSGIRINSPYLANCVCSLAFDPLG
jgi:hypothetical protein